MKLTVIGAGSWGTAIAIHLAGCGHDVLIWAYEDGLAETMNSRRENNLYLENFPLPDGLSATANLQEAFTFGENILLVVPSQFLRGVLKKAAEFYNRKPVICMSKGIEKKSLALMSDVIHETLGSGLPHAVLSGPTFAKEVAAGLPAAAVIASSDRVLRQEIQNLFSSESLRLYTSDDPLGVEIAGALKNVIALASGVVDGLEIGRNAAAALMTRGLHEITRLSVTLGGKKETFAGLAGMGDLILTCTGDLSRNRSVGVRLGRGETLKEILDSMTMVAEGVATTQSAYELSSKLEVEMPITAAMFDLLYRGASALEIARSLMTRKLKKEDIL